jgi:hypothetical protein
VSNSWQAPFLRGWGNTAFVQWLRFLTIFAAVYIFSSFNYTVFQSLATDEYINDIRKSPYYATGVLVEPSYRTKELRMYASLFDVLTVGVVKEAVEARGSGSRCARLGAK